jgi:hypothetical protein
MTKLVRYVCRTPGHHQLSVFDARAPWAPNPLRLREGAWAYCPIGAEDGHEWEQIADRPIDDLRAETERAIGAAQEARSG